MHVLANNLNRHGANMGVVVFMQHPERLGKHLGFSRAAGPLLASVARKRVQCRLANQRIGIVQNSDQIAERLWDQEVVQQGAAVVANGCILVSEALASCWGHCKAHVKERAVRGARPMADAELVNQVCWFHCSLALLAIWWMSDGTWGFQVTCHRLAQGSLLLAIIYLPSSAVWGSAHMSWVKFGVGTSRGRLGTLLDDGIIGFQPAPPGDEMPRTKPPCYLIGAAMKIGYCTWGMPTVPADVLIPFLARLGFDGIELT
ncbi:MAG TPA: hypothetical protein VFS17_02460, partial [Methylophilaceae bacterium]|nr:hypothetical protein [Methylophilaceae bacterium]